MKTKGPIHNLNPVQYLSCITLSLHKTGCKETTDGRGYMGTEAVTETGAICVSWASQGVTDSDLFPDTSIAEASNYCRNPDNKPGGVWCYIGSTDSEWEYCDIPLCEGLITTY